MSTITKLPLIIDTDPGHDDALAIMLLVKSNYFDMKALTTVAGNSTLQNTTNNARYILDLLPSDIPLYSGAEKPLTRPLIEAEVHGGYGMAGVSLTKNEPLNNLAVDKIIELVRANPNTITILVIGPQTNIAAAFQKDSELPSLIKQLVIMGGAIQAPGNKNRVAEFNVFVDPEAADIVFRSSVKKILIPLDICNDIFLTLADFQTLAGSALYTPIMSMMTCFIDGLKKFENFDGALMYDVLAAYYLLNPAAYTITEMDICIETSSELTRGMTVADRRAWGVQKHNVSVVTKIDKAAFVADFLTILRQ